MTSEIKRVHAFAGTGIHASLISALNLVIKYYCNGGSYSSDIQFHCCNVLLVDFKSRV